MTDLIADLKRSLVTPDEDFVTIGAPLASDAPTKLITPDEVNEIAEKSSAVKVEDIEATPIGEVNKRTALVKLQRKMTLTKTVTMTILMILMVTMKN